MYKAWVYVSLGLAMLAVKVPMVAGCADLPEYVVTNENHFMAIMLRGII